MVNYSTGKIYKLHSISHPELGIYIGSTTESLSRRIACHRYDLKRWHAGKGTFTTSYTILAGADDVVITLIEAVACESKDQLLAKERYWIETLECVNKNIPGRTHAESVAAHYATNRDQILAYQSEYRETHRDAINARALEKVRCECGCELARAYISEHRKTKKHRQLMAQQAPPEPAE